MDPYLLQDPQKQRPTSVFTKWNDGHHDYAVFSANLTKKVATPFNVAKEEQRYASKMEALFSADENPTCQYQIESSGFLCVCVGGWNFLLLRVINWWKCFALLDPQTNVVWFASILTQQLRYVIWKKALAKAFFKQPITVKDINSTE